MTILPQYDRRFLKESQYPQAEFRSVETLGGIRVLTLSHNGIKITLRGAHAEQWIAQNIEQLRRSFDEC